MKWTNGLNHTGRILAVFLLVTYAAACTHLPSGEKAFKSFDSCFAANLGLATVGGIGAGILATQLAGGLTGSHSAARNVGAAAGVAVGVMIAMKAWKNCAAVEQQIGSRYPTHTHYTSWYRQCCAGSNTASGAG